jgi:hypothetical protein
MKKQILILLIILFAGLSTTAQVGISASNTPPNASAMLDVSSTIKGLLLPRMTSAQRIAIPTPLPANGLMVFDTDTQTFWVIQSGVWVNLATAVPYTQWSVNGSNIFFNGYVNIGTTTTYNNFTVTHSGNDGMLVKSTSGGSSVDMDGNFGGGISFMAQGQATWYMNSFIDNFYLYNSVTNKKIIGVFGSTNNISFGNDSPNANQNKFEIGNAPNFGGNDLAIGNGTQGMSFSITPNANIWYSNTKFAIMPAGNGTGYLGIGTTNPIAPLHVGSFSYTTPVANSSGFKPYFDATDLDIRSVYTGMSSSSIIADNCIFTKSSFMAFNSVVASDYRIKDIIGITDNYSDLNIIKKIEITNYRMKDKANWGSQIYKKVIAQQVENIYPEAIKKIKSVIPDIYTLAESVDYDPQNKRLSISLAKDYGIKVGDNIELFHPEKGKILSEVVEVSGNRFCVKNWEYPTDKIFVFGKQVDDFRVIDYQRLSMMGISAIQQLSKINTELKNKLKRIESKIATIESNLNTESVKLTSNK